MTVVFVCVPVLSPQTVVELFYQTSARRTIMSQIYSQQQNPSLLLWTHMVSSVVHLLAQLLYPSPGSIAGIHRNSQLLTYCLHLCVLGLPQTIILIIN